MTAVAGAAYLGTWITDAEYARIAADTALGSAAMAVVIGAIAYAITMQVADFDPSMDIEAHDQQEFWQRCQEVRHRVETALWSSYLVGAILYAGKLLWNPPVDLKVFHDGFIWVWIGVGFYGALLLYEAHQGSWNRRLSRFDWIQLDMR